MKKKSKNYTKIGIIKQKIYAYIMIQIYEINSLFQKRTLFKKDPKTCQF